MSAISVVKFLPFFSFWLFRVHPIPQICDSKNRNIDYMKVKNWLKHAKPLVWSFTFDSWFYHIGLFEAVTAQTFGF